MIDNENACRICLEDGATFNIFDEDESIQKKLILCFNEKIEDIQGYPRNICLVCKNTIQAICDFKIKYINTCKILRGEVLEFEIKPDTTYNELEEQLDILALKIPKIEAELKPNKDILQSLTEITIKRVKSEKNVIEVLDSNDSNDDYSDYNDETYCSGRKNKAKGKTKQSKKNVNSVMKRSKKTFGVKNKNIDNKKQKPTSKDKHKSNAKEIENPKLEPKEKPPPTPRLCDICGQIFEKYTQLINHRRTHPKKKYPCDKCDKVYTVRSSLVTHTLKIHDKVVNFICDVCGKEFYVKRHLIDHVNFLHGNKQRKKPTMAFKCKFCDKTFKYKKGMIIHERSVHTGERPAVCNVCDSAFFDESYLREHMRLHTGDVPFKCPVCNRGYAQRGNMKSHMRNHRISELPAEILEKLKPSYLKHLRP